MSESDGRRPLSYIEDEQIEIKPSTELISDEYERKNNENVLVELICRQTDEDADDLAKQLVTLGFLINKTHIDRVNNINETWIGNFVSGVNDKTKVRNYDGLLMIFAKIPFRNDVLKTIWGNFTSTKCPALKNKPKIFIFQISKRGVSSDFVHIPLQIDIKTAYDTPSEADILIVYDKISSESSNDFLENLHNQIKDYGLQEDIINLVSLSIGSEARPLVISTMTRKFFFTINQYRGHLHNINESHAEIKGHLEEIIKFVKTEHKPKDKEKSLLNSFKKTFSFRSKNHHEKDSDNGENRAQGSDKAQKLGKVKEEKHVEPQKQNEVKEAVAGSSKTKPKPIKITVDSPAVPPTKSPTRKASLPSVPVTPTRKISTRTRYPSATFSSKEDLNKKPPWK